eukprot:COSAG06_NODE_59537_length_274_cov_0.462857_1_plen_42_part_10
MFFNVAATAEIFTLSYTLSLHDALPISGATVLVFKLSELANK